MEKRLKISIIGAVIAMLSLLMALLVYLVSVFTPSTEIMSLYEYMPVYDNQAIVVMNDVVYDKPAVVRDGFAYLDLDTVIQYFIPGLYVDYDEALLLLALPDELIRVGLQAYGMEGEHPAAYIDERQQIYVSADFAVQYSDLKYSLYRDPDRVMLNGVYGDYMYMDVQKQTPMRTEPNIKSPVLLQVLPETTVMLVENGGLQEKGFIKVMTADGIRGYVKQNCLSEQYYITEQKKYIDPVYAHTDMPDKVVLGWHQVTSQTANERLPTLLEQIEGMTVISPTWFKVTSDSGDISSIASHEYVNQAHSAGLQVWGLVDNFAPELKSMEMFGHTEHRTRLINNLVDVAMAYELDGINIDFEGILSSSGVHYVEFLKELYIQCRANDLILSVDNYVPSAGLVFYDLAAQGRIADYVIFMGYDEHYSGSEEAGSVSSIGFVSEAMRDGLALVPKERMIMAVPFYTRLWKVERSIDSESGEAIELMLGSEALSMTSAKQTVEANGAEPEWDEETAQYYAEYEKEGVTYRIWLEEERSIAEKLDVIADGDIAGVAAWRLGFEFPEIWDVIGNYVGKQD